MIDVMRAVGADVTWTGEREITIDTSGPLNPETPYELVDAVARVGQRARTAVGALR